MALSLAIQEKIINSFFLKQEYFVEIESYFLTLHANICDRDIDSRTNYLARSNNITWRSAISAIVNATDIEFLAIASGKAVCAVTWGKTKTDDIIAIDIIPLMPFDLSPERKVCYPSETFKIALNDDLQHPAFNDYILSLLYLSAEFNFSNFKISAHTEYTDEEFSTYKSSQPPEATEIFDRGFKVIDWVGDNSNRVVNQNSIVKVALKESPAYLLQYWYSKAGTDFPMFFTRIAEATRVGKFFQYPESAIAISLDDSPILPLVPPSFEIIILDIPHDNSCGVLVGIKALIPYDSVELFISRDGISYEYLQNLVLDAIGVGRILGFTNSSFTHLVIDNHSAIVVDFGNVTIDLSIQEEYLFLWGEEIISSRKISLLSPGVYRLQKLIRGLKGTEDKMRHESSDSLTIISAPGYVFSKHIPLLLQDIGEKIYFQAVVTGNISETIQASFIFNNVAGIAYAPTQPIITQSKSTQDIEIAANFRQSSTTKYPTIKLSLDLVAQQGAIRTLNSNSEGVFDYSRIKQFVDYGINGFEELEFTLYQVNLQGRGKPRIVKSAIDLYRE